MTKLYRLWWGDNNDHSEFYRVRAEDIDQVLKYVKSDILKKDVEYEEQGDVENLYLMFDMCAQCDTEEIMTLNDIEDEEELCEGCEIQEYLEISEAEDEEDERSFKVVYPYGQNNYVDLTEN